MRDDQAERIAVSTDLPHLLEIFSERIFDNPYSPIREYIANARDASSRAEDSTIHVSAAPDYIQISDRGCGMSREKIEEGFTRVAGHYSHSNEASIGMFGLGVLSAFMISDRLEVETRSLDEPHGWRLRWGRGESQFELLPIDRDQPGTTARLYLMDKFRRIATERAIAEYVRKHFSTFTFPIVIGGQRSPINARHSWFAEQEYDGEAKLADTSAAHHFLVEHHKKPLLSVYSYHGGDKVRIFLGIPKAARQSFGLHTVSFFSKGILIKEGARDFFPQNLAFVVGAVDHPEFALQIDRDGFLEDENFHILRDSIEEHIVRFLGLVGRCDPALLAQIMRTHQTMLLAHAQNDTELCGLFRDYYIFDTTIGPRSWKDLVAAIGRRDISPRTIYVFSDEGSHLASPSLIDRHAVMVYATGTERELLKRLAAQDGIHVADSSKLLATPGDVPAPFHELATRLAIPLLPKGVNSVEFFHSPGQNSFPASLRLHGERADEPGRAVSLASHAGEDASLLSVDALLLNTAHPIIQDLAGRCSELGVEVIRRAADILFSISALQSPFDQARAAVTNAVVEDLIKVLTVEIGGGTPAGPSTRAAKCFVALPYRPEFVPVWEGLRSLLGKPPFSWDMVRADHQVEAPDILDGIVQHVATSSRYIADVSKLNTNVVLELGMMIQKSHRHTLILCDRETFPDLPCDLKGQIPLVYPEQARRSAESFAAWLQGEITRFPLIIAMHGAGAEAPRVAA